MKIKRAAVFLLALAVIKKWGSKLFRTYVRKKAEFSLSLRHQPWRKGLLRPGGE